MQIFPNPQYIHTVCYSCSPFGSFICLWLLPNKQQISYEEVIISTAYRYGELGFTPDPPALVTDFDNSAINAIQVFLGHYVRTEGHF